MKFLALVLIAIGIGILFSAPAMTPAQQPVHTPEQTEECSDLDYMFGEKLVSTTFEDWFRKSSVPNYSRPVFL